MRYADNCMVVGRAGFVAQMFAATPSFHAASRRGADGAGDSAFTG